MKVVWDIVKDNLSYIKDILWIVFTFVATAITVLTYRKARFTLLQPLRTEVVKRQTELLVELLDFLDDDKPSFQITIDYIGIIECNIYRLLKHYGFILSGESQDRAVNDNIAGAIILKSSGRISSFQLPTAIDDLGNLPAQDNSKNDYELAKQGIVDLEILHLTKRHTECMDKLHGFMVNPFMPQEIQSYLEKLRKDISENLGGPMKYELEQFVKELFDKYQKKPVEMSLPIDPTAVYNRFQRKSKKGSSYITSIRHITRKYLMIDKKWG